MRESLLIHRLLYLLAFCVASAWFFSNLSRDSFSIGNAITIFSIILSLTLVRAADIKVIFLIAAFIYLSSIQGAFGSDYFINFSYKILSFLPVVILVKCAPIDIVYKAVLHSFLSSTLIAILLLILGYTAPQFIIYDDFIPRFAGLAIEPVSFALGAVVLFVFYLLRFRSASVFVSTLFYVPIVVAVSGIILIKIAIDFFDKVKLKYFFLGFPIVFLAIWFLLNETRAGESIEMRLYLYSETLKTIDNTFWGSGFYFHEGAKGLPGIARIYYELGFIFLFTLLLYYFVKIIRYRLYRWPFLFVAMAFPFITEAYGAPLLWLVSMYCLHRGNEYLGSSTVVLRN